MGKLPDSSTVYLQSYCALLLFIASQQRGHPHAVMVRNLVEESQAAGQNATWDAVMDRLTELYLDDDEREYRGEQVDNLRQTPYQDTREYGQRFSTVVQKAYTAAELLVPLVLQRVIKNFISGLRDKQVHLDGPATLAAPVQGANGASRAISRAEVEGRMEELMADL